MIYMCPFLHDSVGHMMECTAVDKGRCVVPRRPLTYTPSIDVFLALYEHRCVSLPWSVWGVDVECNLTDEFGYLEAFALAAPKPKANSLLQTFDGLGGGPRGCNLLFSVH